MSNFVEIKDKDGVTLGQLPVSKEGGRLRNIVYMTESGTYEKPAWLKFAIVKGVGGGGARGGIGTTTSTIAGASGGGGGGGYFEKQIDAAALAESETVTVGAGGTAGAVGNSAGGNGGTTSFGTHCSATGGGGTTGSTGAAAVSSGGVGGAATGGDINISGGAGVVSRGTYTSTIVVQILGVGGESMLGSNSSGYGTGAQGRTISPSVTEVAGLAGNPGIVIIEEYE